MTDRRSLPTMPDDAAARLEVAIQGVRQAHAGQSVRWFALFVQVGRAREAVSRGDVAAASQALRRAASLEHKLCGHRDNIGYLADEFEDAAGRPEHRGAQRS